MRLITFLCVVLSSAACSGSDDGEAPCDLAHRHGTYIQHFAERAGGTCGKLTDQVGTLDSATMLLPGCVLDHPDSASADQCTLTRSLTCPLDGADGTSSAVAVTREHDSGDTIDGTITMRVYDGSGGLVCVSTYDLSASRQ